MSTFLYCNNGRPCGVCGSHEDCRESSDGLRFCKNRHAGDWSPGNAYVGESRDGLWGMWRDELDLGRRSPQNHGPAATRPMKDVEKEQRTRRRAAYNFASGRDRSIPLDDAAAIKLARSLGLPATLLKAQWRCFKPDRDGQTFVLPEYGFDAGGAFRPVCYLWRELDGTKRNHGDPDCPVKRGLTMAEGWDDNPGPIYLPEGASDTMALHAMGLAAWGRPSSRAGVETVARLLAQDAQALAGRELVILGENDERPNGRWEGRDGAHATAQKLADLTGRPVRVAMPPPGFKDVRDWFKAHWKPGSDPKKLGARFAIETGFRQVFRPAAFRPPEVPNEESQVVNAALAMASLVARGKERRAEEEAPLRANAARVSNAMRADRLRYQCPCCRKLVFRHREEGSPYVGDVCCQKWFCEACRRWLIAREMGSTAFHFAAARKLFETVCTDDEWPMIRMRVRRAGGEYRRIRRQREGGWYIVSDAAAEGMVPVSVESAMFEFRCLLGEWEGDSRPVTSSHAWKLLGCKAETKMELLTVASPSVDSARTSEIAATFDASPVPKTSRRPEQGGWVARLWAVEREGGWSVEMAKAFASAMADDFALPSGFKVEFDFGDSTPGRQTDLAEDLATAL